MSITISDLITALNKVEHIHKIQVENVHLFFKTNEAIVLNAFKEIISRDSIDERFMIINKEFSALGDVKTYLLEASYLVS
ncbi:hypothetical protein VA249_17180 [Vibrio alfacsensis]|uniref:hypothetical protein n=1 Tax=Vibrio alfacsensis TaxID=1074311 RepID=UPI001BEDC3B9|nr:hypothetical protein [Vibrio alfacsensis]BBM65072.1 hypothetical protein VA249_17180 [Vibrio alfacsensis]